jgi:sugar/nucleoside kinase (ribokinase family)
MKKYQVVGIGNAVVDVICESNDTFLSNNGIEKGIMQLVDQGRGEALYAAMDNRVQTPGGSVANTIAGLGELGLRTGFIGGSPMMIWVCFMRNPCAMRAQIS